MVSARWSDSRQGGCKAGSSWTHSWAWHPGGQQHVGGKADSVAVHRGTVPAGSEAEAAAEGLSTAAGPTAAGLTAGSHTSRLVAGGSTAGGFTSLIASWRA